MQTTFKNQNDKEKYEKIVMDRLKALEKKRSDHASKKISAITIQISPSDESERSYKIFVQNSGDSKYNNIRIRYEPIILWAGHFGLDTTHMPVEWQFANDEPLLIDELPPSAVIEFNRKGYGRHQSYDGPQKTEVFVTGPTEIVSGFPVNNFNWCEAIIELPNANGTRPV
jgi:hypothetical protein